MNVVIVDYGMGNLRSVEKALEKVGVPAVVSSHRDDVLNATALVVPGVGAFGDAMEELSRLDLVVPLRQRAADGVPILGICLGLQIFFEESEEAPGVPGLGLVQGRVRRFSPAAGLKIPHMGWNALNIRAGTRLFEGVPDGAYVYFVHSYFVAPTDEQVVAATTAYGVRFAAAIETRNIFGVQFHPEKSQRTGLNILANFGRIIGEAAAAGGR
jgi:glutamine amidotransferase